MLIVNYFFLFIVSIAYYPLHAELSLRSVKSWVTGAQEQTFLQEYPFPENNTLIINNESGNITIKGWSLPKIALEATKSAGQKDLSSLTIQAESSANVLSIKTIPATTIKNWYVDYHLLVPSCAQLIINVNHGSIKIKDVSGTIQALTSDGTIDIEGARNTLNTVASGKIAIHYSDIASTSTSIIKSLKNSVTLELPKIINTSIKAVTNYNSIISDHFITINPMTIMLNKQNWDRMKREVCGYIGKGGPSIDIIAYNGITLLQH